MPGFPTRPTRRAFGPTRQDDGVTSDDAKYVGAVHFNLDFWQVAGMGVVAARAACFIDLAAGTPVIAWHTEAWDPDAEDAAPTLNHPGVGEFQLVYAASYPDEKGTAVATAVKGALAIAQSLTDFRTAQKIAADGITVDLRLRDSAGAVHDGGAADGLLVLLW